MSDQQKQELIRQLRELRDAFERQPNLQHDADLLKHYYSLSIKAVAILDSALITLST